MRYLFCSLLFAIASVLHAQSPEEIVQKVGSSFQKRSTFELTEKPLGHVQQGILIMRPTRLDAIDLETIITINEMGGRYVNMAANPGRIKVWRDDEVIFDGRSKTIGVPQALDAGVFRAEFRHLLPPFRGDYQIRVEYYPEGESSTVFLWLTDERGNMMHDRDFRSDWDFMETHLYRFKSRTSTDELDWQFPTEITGLQYDSENGMNDWQYANGMMLDAMWLASEHFTSIDYKKFVEKHLEFFVENFDRVVREKESSGVIESPFNRYFRYQQVDDFGAQTVPFLNLPESETSKKFTSKGLNKLLYRALRLSDGSYARLTPDSLSVWSEDLYMSTVLLCRAYAKNGSQKYLQEAIKQTILFNKHLKDRNSRVYVHGFFAENVEQSASKWARSNGLVIMANVELLRVMSENHPERESILRIYRSHASSLRDFQSLDGRWHQVLDNDTTYLETSGSAMIVAAFAEGLQNNWLFNKAEFRQSTIKGWVAITEQIDDEGNVSGVSPDTSILYSDEEYENLQPIVNHPAALGAILYAAMAIDKLDSE
ncbi:MAG: glycoside hydrolase family 88 protein [Cyclobacteriaceae bacterium]